MSFHSHLTDGNEDKHQYRQYVSGLDLPTKEIDAMIDIVHSILSYFVDAAFNVQTDQITLGSIREARSSASPGCATIEHHPDNQTAHVQTNGVGSDSSPVGPIEP